MDEKKSLKLAIHGYVEAIQKSPRDPALYTKLGDLQRQCGDCVGASQSYRSATVLRRNIENDPLANPTIEPLNDNTLEYLDLLKNCLTYQFWNAGDGKSFEVRLSKPFISSARILLRIKDFFKPTSTEQREFGLDWPAKAFTMVGKERLDNIEYCTKMVLQDNIPGDLIETGVWRGGCTIFMRALLKSYGDAERIVWVADSFAGMPKPNKSLYPQDKKFDLSMWRTLKVSSNEVRENFKKFGLLDGNVKFLEGWFSETLPHAPIEKLSVIRLDGDLYESTMDGLKNLYPKLSAGGFIIVDDYYCSAPCKQAIDDYRAENHISEEIIAIDWSAVYWRKKRDNNI